MAHVLTLVVHCATTVPTKNGNTTSTSHHKEVSYIAIRWPCRSVQERRSQTQDDEAAQHGYGNDSA